VVILQRFGTAKIFSLGGGTTAIFANELRVAHILFIFFQIVFHEPDIFSHAQMGLMSLMRLRQVLGKWKPFSHNLTPLEFSKMIESKMIQNHRKNLSTDKMLSMGDRLVIDNNELLIITTRGI
jgi:hypothetical protein